jgi:hypothetical protein
LLSPSWSQDPSFTASSGNNTLTAGCQISEPSSKPYRSANKDRFSKLQEAKSA